MPGAGALIARLSRWVGAGFHGSGGAVLLVGTEVCWSVGGREGIQLGQGAGDDVGSGPVPVESEVPATGGGDELGGGSEKAEP